MLTLTLSGRVLRKVSRVLSICFPNSMTLFPGSISTEMIMALFPL